MTKTKWVLGTFALFSLCAVAPAMAAPQCGANTGKPATGAPVVVGGIHGNGTPGDFSSATAAAAAYFACVNANGGINGRPVEYHVENDQWNPELASQAATKLVLDTPTVAMVANGSAVEMSVNAQTYAKSDIMVIASACATSECYETPNIVAVNQGPLASSLGAVQYAREELGVTNVACITLNIPNSGQWSCDAVTAYMKSKGGTATTALMNPAAPDVNSVVLEATSSGANGIVLVLPGSLGVAVLKAVEEQDLGGAAVWLAPTSMYDKSIPGQLGPYWNNRFYVNAELAPFQINGPDMQNWNAVLDAYGKKTDARDSFSQAGYLAARFFVEAVSGMNPADLSDRKKVSDAIRAIKGAKSDMLCGPYYTGNAKFHMPNTAGYMVKVNNGAYEVIRNCYSYDSSYFDKYLAEKKALGL
jgi:branched-chain amino acid transport system substrate-binding protein